MGEDPGTDIEQLHRELFGFVPAKAGTAYERIAALVLATLGWTEIVHDVTERPLGGLADHQLDVTCRSQDGTVRRLLVECKEWNTKPVGQAEMLQLSAVAARVGASHAAMVTKLAFTEGARAVAVDDDIALIRLRPYNPSIDDGTWIRAVRVDMRIGFPVNSDIMLLIDGNWESANEHGVWAEEWMDVTDQMGENLGTWADLFALGRPRGSTRTPSDAGCPMEVVFESPRLVEGSGGWISVEGVRWRASIQEVNETIRTEAKGEPTLVLQQLDGNGDPHAGRVVVDTKLRAFEIDNHGAVTYVRLPS